MFERLSGNTQRVLIHADEESRRLGHGRIGTEHLLLGILAEGNSAAAKALRSSGATLEGSRSKVEEAVGVGPGRAAGSAPGEGSGGTDALPLSDRAKRAMERANRLSLRQLETYVETEHLLLSVLDVEGRAGQILRGLAVDPAALRQTVDALVEDRVWSTTPGAGVSTADAPAADTLASDEAAEPGMPRCAGCGAALDRALAHRIMTSHGGNGEPRDFVIAYCLVCGRAIGASASGIPALGGSSTGTSPTGASATGASAIGASAIGASAPAAKGTD